jgi:hypothetical protein
MPETARRYCVTRATRRFVANSVGSRELVGLTERDELFALRNLKRDQGNEDNFSIFASYETFAHLGWPRRLPGGVIENRKTRGYTP